MTSQDETASQTTTIDQMTTPNTTSTEFDTSTLVNLVDMNAPPIIASTSTTPQDDSTVQITIIEPVVDSLSSTTTKIVNNLSDQIRGILQHFGEPEPIGFPNQTILPDSLDVPNVTQDLGIGTGQYYNMTVYGLANFTVESINMLLDQLEVHKLLRTLFRQ